MGVLGHWPGIKFPRIPGHEIVGRVVKVGANVKRFKVGERVGRGWHGSHCFQCDACVSGDVMMCETHDITGMTCDGGYAEYTVCPWESLARVPESLKAEEAAPLLCAGVTVYNALRHSNAKAGDLVAVQGIGGLGHLGIQFARKMGYRVAAVSSGADKKELALKLGAHDYIDASKENAAAALKKLGGAKVVLTTAFDSKAMSSLTDGLCAGGTLLVVGADVKPLEVTPLQLIVNRANVQGWPSGRPVDSEETLKFAAVHGVYAMAEVYPLEKAQEAYERMMSNKQRFRVVLVPGHKEEEAQKGAKKAKN
jgi:2-desacetyl-2-hydroxyethyl bacteriochlorophyllide A dehydrogenase